MSTQHAALTVDGVQALLERPFMDLVMEAAAAHRAHHDPHRVQWSTLLSVKTGACPEDCGYCSQSARFDTGLKREALLDADTVEAAAQRARAGGSTRFCMGAAWRKVADRDLPALVEMVKRVKDLGMETCMTLGTVSPEQARALADAGLDYYNHNLDTSREHYGDVVTTRGYDERLQTLAAVRDAGMATCCGGIVGLGETVRDRAGLLWQLATLPEPPQSVPINQLVPIPGTPLADAPPVHWTDMVRTVAAARILLPTSQIRLSAGRETMSEELQAWCFLVGANSIFTGDRLLTTGNRSFREDRALLAKLDMTPDRLDAPMAAADAPAGAPARAR
jgi:biotin synthase